MQIEDTFKTSIRGLLAHKSRSLLTILGIVIGVTAIVLVVSVGKGAEEVILDQIRVFGSRSISVEPGRQPSGPSDFGEIFSDSIKKRDLEVLSDSSRIQGISGLTPTVFQNQTISYAGETFRTSVLGSTEFIAEIFDIYPETGSFFTESDIATRASVAVIGSKVKEELFGLSNAVGEKIKVKDRQFRVVGVLKPKGQVSFFNLNKLVIIPYTTAQEYILGINHFHSIIVQAESEEIVPRLVSDIELTLAELHGIQDPEKYDFHLETQAEAAALVGNITGIMTALLFAVAAVSLVVGGVGIMNIMLVSVVERTKEIGLRKAVGATNKDILNQFLLEAIILTAIGGIIGILLGVFFSFATSLILSRIVSIGWRFVFSIPAAIIGLVVSAFIGLVFGLYPAQQAAKKSPIDALRYE